MIDSITRLDLSLLVCNGLSVRARKLDPKLCIKRRQAKRASEIKDKINISCYTEYKAFGPSLIYNNLWTDEKLQHFQYLSHTLYTKFIEHDCSVPSIILILND